MSPLTVEERDKHLPVSFFTRDTQSALASETDKQRRQADTNGDVDHLAAYRPRYRCVMVATTSQRY